MTDSREVMEQKDVNGSTADSLLVTPVGKSSLQQQFLWCL